MVAELLFLRAAGSKEPDCFYCPVRKCLQTRGLLPDHFFCLLSLFFPLLITERRKPRIYLFLFFYRKPLFASRFPSPSLPTIDRRKMWNYLCIFLLFAKNSVWWFVVGLVFFLPSFVLGWLVGLVWFLITERKPWLYFFLLSGRNWGLASFVFCVCCVLPPFF